MSSELKYTDRDVRENEYLYEQVVAYLEQYQGEFSYLIDCKMRLNQGVELSVGMIRGALNCMRVDPRVTNLPEPLPPEEGNVIEMPRKKGRFTRGTCQITEPHGPHPSTDEMYSCGGVFLINRSAFRLPLKIKRPMVTARSTGLIHMVMPEGGHNSVWYPPLHEYGWGMYGIETPDYHVKLGCKFPSWLKNPILLTSEEAAQLTDLPTHAGQRLYCSRCFP